jgi:ABC-2 type transport system permease protein
MARLPVKSPTLWIAGKYLSSFGMGLKASLEYRTNFLFGLAATISPIVIQTALWLVLFDKGGSETLFGFSFSQMIAYTVVAQLVSRLVRTGFEYDIHNDIKSGGLDRFLVKPVGYFGYRLFAFLGDKAFQTILMGLILSASILVMASLLGFSVTPLVALAFCLSLVLAFSLNFLVFWCVSMLCFGLQEIGFLFEAVRIVIITLSGGIFPLEVFGPAWAKVLKLLPFRFTIQLPTEILCGRLSLDSAMSSLLVGFAWAAAFLLPSYFMWKSGLRRFAAIGS